MQSYRRTKFKANGDRRRLGKWMCIIRNCRKTCVGKPTNPPQDQPRTGVWALWDPDVLPIAQWSKADKCPRNEVCKSFHWQLSLRFQVLNSKLPMFKIDWWILYTLFCIMWIVETNLKSSSFKILKHLYFWSNFVWSAATVHRRRPRSWACITARELIDALSAI